MTRSRNGSFATTGGTTSASPPAKSMPPPEHPIQLLMRTPATSSGVEDFDLGGGFQPDVVLYHDRWSHVVMGATSGFMFTIACFIGYCCFLLMSPYMAGISFGILLSIVMHPSSRRRTPYRDKCVERMTKHNQSWQHVGALYRWIGSIGSLNVFVRYMLMEAVHFLGLQKFRVGKKAHRRSLETTKSGRDVLRVVAMGIFVATSTMLAGVLPLVVLHVTLAIVSLASVHFFSEKAFTLYLGRLWRYCVLAFLATALVYNFFLDVVVVTDTVQRTTSVVVDSSRSMVLERGGTNWTSAVLQQVQSRLMRDFVGSLNASNMSDVVFHVKALEPLLSNLSWATGGGGNWTVVMEQAYDVYAELSSSHEDIPSMLATVFARFQETWTPLLLVVLSWPLSILRNMVNVFDVVYECILFIFVYRYLTTLPHTVVYYLIAKMLTPLHARLGARHARNIERDITISFRTLFQSFWHITWLHFSVTFCCFKFWGTPLPFCVGMIAVAMALFPLVPKWFSPCSMRLVYLLVTRLLWGGGVGDLALLHRVVDAELCMFAAALVVVVNDEWLLSVERGLHGSRQQDARGVLREQLPTFVIGTCIILGLVVYGLRGVLLGPLTVIVARTIFDNWDIMSGQLAASPAGAAAGTTTQQSPGRMNASFSATLPPSRCRGGDDDDAMSDASRGSNEGAQRAVTASAVTSAAVDEIGYTVRQTDDVLQLKKRQ